ncbi:hypothetical protein KP509_10G042300 [Ceratopteris richardii]|uniref:Cysteine proteinase inhibitor n=1 Tax=Ceratopteris richardii TaxID=49495 RepID=A0A8T2U0G4_CERRI|nr:hypothetical protein KP509_10G042300 [Ceratopteris richardii]KAH7427396.1 hypothetical protein KP509_10G042300 [Ceratopteris richardii]
MVNFNATKISCLLVLVIMALVSGTMAEFGGREKIPNAQSDPELWKLAVFAVSEYNSQKGLQLQLLQVVSGEKQVVSGIMYYLVIKATSYGHSDYYQAKIWVQAWRNFKSLESFEKIQSPV